MPDWIGTFQNRAPLNCSKRGQHCIDTTRQGFPSPFTHGEICPHPIRGDKSIWGGTSAGGESVNGGDIDPMRPNFDRLSHKLKVLLMLNCNYTMQFIGYDSINTR